MFYSLLPLALVCAIATMTACTKTQNDPGQSSAGSSSPSALSVYTGPAVLRRAGEPFSGQLVDATTFVNCHQQKMTVEASDKVTPGGTCSSNYDYIVVPALAALQQTGGKVLINSVVVDGDTAVATYVKGDDAGQVLMVRSGSSWIAKATTSGTLTKSSVAVAGISTERVARIQRQLRFDVTATPLPAPIPTTSP